MKQAFEPAAFSIEQAANYLSVSGRFVYKLLADDKIKARKAGRKTLVIRQSLDRYLSELPAFGRT